MTDPSSRSKARAPRQSPGGRPRPVRFRPLPELDRTLHDRMRLAIAASLAANPSLSFRELKQLLDTTDGNLSVHARKLEDAGYVACSKTFQGRVPRTDYRLTAAGRRAFERYLDHLEAVVANARA